MKIKVGVRIGMLPQFLGFVTELPESFMANNYIKLMKTIFF